MTDNDFTGSKNFQKPLAFPPRDDVNADFEGAFRKDGEGSKHFVEFAEEIQDLEMLVEYINEITQTELVRGNKVHFVTPTPVYVLKTSVNGEKKGFINICSNPLIRKAAYQHISNEEKSGGRWAIPFVLSPSKEDVDKVGSFCLVYDAIFNPETLALSRKDKALRERLEMTAIEGVEKSFNLTLDKNNIKKPKLRYKGLVRAVTIKYKIEEPLPPVIEPSVADENQLPPDSIVGLEDTEQRHKYVSDDTENSERVLNSPPTTSCGSEKSRKGRIFGSSKGRLRLTRSMSDGNEGDDDESWTEPRYSYKYRSHVDTQCFSVDNRKAGKTTPDELILTVDLPLLRDSSTLDADVVDGGTFFELKSEVRARYKLKLKLPHQVDGDSTRATFDKDKRKLTVTMKIIHRRSDQSGKPLSVRDREGFFLKNENADKSRSETDDDESNQDVESSDAGSLASLGRPIQVISSWTNDGTVKGILKRSGRVRSLSESFVDKLSILRSGKDDSVSLESLNEEVESDEVLSASPVNEKSVRFNDAVQRQLYRSNSSILGQKKKNQRRNKNKKKARERANSEGSVSSLDVDADDEDHGYTSSSSIIGHSTVRSAGSSSRFRNRDKSGTSTTSADDDDDDDNDDEEELGEDNVNARFNRKLV